MKKLLILLLISPTLLSDEVVQKFKNPSFSGQGTSAHYLTIENQELQNQKLYLSGEQQKLSQKLALEQQALNEEIAAYGRQETRDIQQLNRLAAQQQNAQQRAMEFQAGGDAALMAGLTGFTQSATQLAGIGADFYKED